MFRELTKPFLEINQLDNSLELDIKPVYQIVDLLKTTRFYLENQAIQIDKP